ncbi:hypothetical protein [Neisseria musculi]
MRPIIAVRKALRQNISDGLFVLCVGKVGLFALFVSNGLFLQ